jgi:uncharacterized protein
LRPPYPVLPALPTLLPLTPHNEDVLPGSCEIQLAGETLQLLPQRAIYWPRESTLFVADVHFGKAAAMRAAAIAVPGGTTSTDLARLDELLDLTGAGRLVLLGDLWHAKKGLAPETVRVVAEWRQSHSELDIRLVIGNHDRRTGKLPAEVAIDAQAEGCCLGPFTLLHDPAAPAEGYALAGHVHPAVRLTGRAAQSATLRCFWVRPHVCVLPSFGSFTGSAIIEPEKDDRILVVTGESVQEIALRPQRRVNYDPA